MLKKIDGVVLKNSRLNAALPSSFHFEACRLISRSDRPKGCKTEDLFYGKLEAEFDDFQKSTVDFTQKHKLSHHISASHSGGECLTKFWTDWAEKNDKLVSPEDPFITINPRPRAFLTVQDHYSIRVTVEYPQSYPETVYHKMSVAFLGSMRSDAFVFEWSYRQSSKGPWQAFDDESLQVQRAVETRKPEVRVSSKRFVGDNVEFVRVVIHDADALPLAEIQQVIYDDKVERPMPSQGRYLEKRPIGSRVPLLSK
jgi:hypothetical protein